MQYSKPMIELIYEIRRRVPADLKPAVKLANPELFNELTEYYHESGSAVARALIKELFALAGPPWRDALNTPTPVERQVSKVYRGQTRLEAGKTQQDAPAVKEDSDGTSGPVKKKLVYRGQVVG